MCGSEFSDAETEGFENCPKCHTSHLPMAISEDVDLKINWHEIRILTIWAENWAKQCDKSKKEENMLYIIMCIAERLQHQYPDKTPITLFSEIRELRKHYDVTSDVDDDEQLES